MIAVPDKDTIILAYLAYYTNSPMGMNIVKRNERGAAQGHLNVTVYGRLPINVPTLIEQQKIIEELKQRAAASSMTVLRKQVNVLIADLTVKKKLIESIESATTRLNDVLDRVEEG